MAAELTFKNVLTHITKSGLNFSIYLTPFSAQLSLKKSFAKKFYQETVDEVVIEENLVEQLESRLKKIDSENHKLVETLNEREEALATLETKCDMMEETMKVERKKLTK